MTDACFSTGEAALALGVSRDSLVAALRAGAPEPKQRVGGRRMFSSHDIDQVRSWFASRRKALTANGLTTASGSN